MKEIRQAPLAIGITEKPRPHASRGHELTQHLNEPAVAPDLVMLLETQQLGFPADVIAGEFIEVIAVAAERIGAKRGAHEPLMSGLHDRSEHVAQLLRFSRMKDVRAAVKHA